jgi:hypothetical protein
VSVFADLFADARQDIDGVFGERLLITPMIGASDYDAGGPDPDRSPVEVIGLIKFGDAEQATAGDRTNYRFIGRLGTGEVAASIALRVLNGFVPKVGDRLTALARQVDRDFEIGEVEADGTSAMLLRLVRTSS